MDEFQSTTHGHGSSTSFSYDTYYDLLINACVRYDKTKKANIGKRRNVYATNIDETYIDLPTACIDHVPDSPYGCIDLPPDEFYQVHALSSRHPPPQRPGQPSRPPFRPQSQHSGPTRPIRRYDGPIFLPPQIYKILSQDAMKALKAYNTEAITRFHQRKVHNTEIVEQPQDDPPGPPVPDNDLPDLPESDLDIPDDPNLDFVNSQCHTSEDLDQALQAYQAYQVPCPQDSTMTPERSINRHFTYHIAQASQPKHGSLVDRGANGGLAGSDVRILSRSSRKCTVTGIDSHELQGLDVVQCAAIVETYHGIVNLIMNEYACYGKGHTIHSSGQIEWFKNSVDDRSVQVGGKQRICTTDGYAMPLICRGGLMYLSLLGKPTDKDLERYPAVHLTGPHKWDPSVLDYTPYLVMGSLHGPMTLVRDLPLILTLMSLGITLKEPYKLSLFWMTLHPTRLHVLPSWPISMILEPTNMLSIMRPLTMINSGLILVGSMWTLFRKPWNSLPNGNRTMSKSKGWTLQSSLLMLWMEKTRVNNQTKIDDNVNLLKTL